jgi:SAM-dependent methyltransferase
MQTPRMTWRISQAESRRRYLEKFDAAEVEAYDALVATLSAEDVEAYRADLASVFAFHQDGLRILDAGAGSGALSQVLCGLTGLQITALEPSPAMLARLHARRELEGVRTVEGFCDHLDDRRHFPGGAFDAIFSRQLANGLYDPLAAFRNWHHWLKPSGAVVLVDGLYGRSAWTGRWEEEIDVLPLSACQTTATVPYLLEMAGFRIDRVQLMQATNARPSTRTSRYLVRATRVG